MQALLLTLTGRSSPPGACRGRRPPGSWLQDHCWVSVATQEVWGQSQPQVSGGPYPGRALGLSSALRSCSSSPYLDYATEFLSRWSPVKGRPLKLTSRVPPSPGPRAREPAPSRDHQTGMERGRQEEDSSAIPSLETSGPSFQLFSLFSFPKALTGTPRPPGPLSHTEDKPHMVVGAPSPHCSELYS